MGFLFSVYVYVFIPMVLFLWLKFVKNCQKWVYMGMGEIFFVWDLKKLSKRAAKYTAHKNMPISQTESYFENP